jgi:hypothetical protein
MDFGSIHLKISRLTASAMAELSRNISTDETEELVFNSDCEEQPTSDVFDMEHRIQ